MIRARGRGAGEVVDLIDLEPERMDDIVPQKLEVAAAEQMSHVRLLAGEKVVDADDIMPHVDQTFTEVAAKKASTAGDENPFNGWHL